MDVLSPAFPSIAAATCRISEFTGHTVKMLLMCAHEQSNTRWQRNVLGQGFPHGQPRELHKHNSNVSGQGVAHVCP